MLRDHGLFVKGWEWDAACTFFPLASPLQSELVKVSGGGPNPWDEGLVSPQGPAQAQLFVSALGVYPHTSLLLSLLGKPGAAMVCRVRRDTRVTHSSTRSPMAPSMVSRLPLPCHLTQTFNQ